MATDNHRRVESTTTADRFSFHDLTVSCYAGYRGEETPRRFSLGVNTVEVTEIIDRWLSPDHRYFKLRGDDEALYILRHDLNRFQWELVFYKR
jgi:hypothetical protein